MGQRRSAAPSSIEAKRRMQMVRQKNTSAELMLRRELWALGLRYRIHRSVISKPRRVADVLFASRRIAVFIDGCFWHGCPLHATWPKQNAEFWRNKIVANKERDDDTDARLRAEGWDVIRIWAHEDPREAALRIADSVRERSIERDADVKRRQKSPYQGRDSRMSRGRGK
jgi:DNA mismatch endonuclease (patch repair protein)